ncbi:hypothetical protein ACIDE9_12095, partial [Methylophilus sp. 'Pure River']|uniref:hypothetical protein n=1 Tax=Methylophilus sp. 'Pure River' TaxID=3377117 RepID=UPI00398E9CF5
TTHTAPFFYCHYYGLKVSSKLVAIHTFGKSVFRPNGGFALHLFDSIAYALPKVYPSIMGNEAAVAHKIEVLTTDAQYNSIGTSTFSNTRIRNRMDRALEIFASD